MTYAMGFSTVLVAGIPLALSAQVGGGHAAHHPARTDIPLSVQAEHKEIHGQLETAMKRTDAIGAAARELAQVLHPHFVREEQIALKPLGALQALARGAHVADADVLRAMADSLERELPRMLDEHKAIAAVVTKLQRAAVAAGAEEWVRFAQQLKQHALAEEEVYYPAAILAGRQLRGMHSAKP